MHRMTRLAVLVALLVATLAPSVGTQAPEKDQRMQWWRDARFGMFIHWGLYAVPAGDYKGQRSKDIG